MRFLHTLNEVHKFITKRLAVMLMKYLFGIRSPDPQFRGRADSIIILGQERFGDLIVLTPLIRKLRETYPTAMITLAGVTNSIDFLRDDPNLNWVINIKRDGSAARRKILKERYDLLFNSKDHPSFTFLYLTARIHAEYKIGIYHRAHIGYFNYMHFFEDAQPAVEKNMAPLHVLNIHFKGSDLRPYMPHREASPEIADFVKTVSREKTIGINLSASNPGKEWPLSSWKDYLADIDFPVAIMAMPDDAEKKADLERTFNNILPSPPTKTLSDAGHLIRSLKLLVSTDTALIHVAGCYDVPVVVLYRLERDMKKFPPLSTLKEIIINPSANLEDITADQVITATRAILNRL